MNVERTVFLSAMFATVAMVAISIIAAQPPSTSIMYTLVRQRDDFTVLADQGGNISKTFQTVVAPRSGYVEVFRNGLLQRAGATADYNTSLIGGIYRVTFNPSAALQNGDYITLFYYR